MQKDNFQASQKNISLLQQKINTLETELASLRDQSAGPKPTVLIKTNKGEIVIELDHVNAPITVENFLQYTKDQFFDGLVFHRVISNFMIQGGGFDQKLVQKKPLPPIRNEAVNGLKNERGTIAMARTGDPHSATSQFFINVNDNASLNYGSPVSPDGYAVFGQVVKGMDVVDMIRAVKTTQKTLTNPDGVEFDAPDVPVDTVVIESVTVIKNGR
ncbi:MAG: peptidylprolyl isomerase [Phycisphaerae bacterium]|nr:peptidylprolyl isomerase [Phycisphaerae bacterium]